jgi:hypothetical protein
MAKQHHQPTDPVVTFALVAGLTLVGCFAATPLPSGAVERSCRSIGRIMTSSSPSLQPWQLICAGDPPPAAKLTFFCATTGRIQAALPGIRVEKQGCLASIPAEIRCPGMLLCTRPKGGQEQALSLTAPMGTALLKSPTQLRWLPSASAQSYLVQVEGLELQWQRIAKDTALPYPTDVDPLQPGQTYRLTIIAMDAQGTPLAGRTKALSIVSLDRAQQIQTTAQQLQRLPVDPDELAAIDLKALYLANGLAEEAIAVLESRVTAGTQSPLVYQALGQTYARVRDEESAITAYQRAIELAQTQGQQTKQLEAELKQLTVAWQSEPTPRQ